MKSLPVGAFPGFTAGLGKVDAKSPGDKNKTRPLTLRDRLRIGGIGNSHNTSITGVFERVNTTYTGVEKTSVILVEDLTYLLTNLLTSK